MLYERALDAIFVATGGDIHGDLLRAAVDHVGTSPSVCIRSGHSCRLRLRSDGWTAGSLDQIRERLWPPDGQPCRYYKLWRGSRLSRPLLEPSRQIARSIRPLPADCFLFRRLCGGTIGALKCGRQENLLQNSVSQNKNSTEFSGIPTPVGAMLLCSVVMTPSCMRRVFYF